MSENTPQKLELLESARQAYEALCMRFRQADAELEPLIPDWDPQDRLTAQWVACSSELALLMLAADHELSEAEFQAFNQVFGLKLTRSEVSAISEGLEAEAETRLFEHLGLLLQRSSVLDLQRDQDLSEPVLDFLRSLGRIMALVDEVYHPDENLFYQRLLPYLRPQSALASASLSFRLSSGQQLEVAL